MSTEWKAEPLSTALPTIGCPVFGGSRLPAACVALDRYKRCRKSCPALAAFLKDKPGFVEKAVSQYKAKSLEQPGLFGLQSMKMAGRGLVSSELRCSSCAFAAASRRGLRVHRKRSHGLSEESSAA